MLHKNSVVLLCSVVPLNQVVIFVYVMYESYGKELFDLVWGSL